MRRVLKLVAIVLGSLALGALLLVGLSYGYIRWQFHLPSDAKAKAYFTAHRAALESLVETVVRDPNIEFVNARGIAYGSTASDPAYLACAKHLRELGAQSLRRHSRGLVEIYFWGAGCAVCHDSYKGFAYVADPSFNMPLDSKVCSSLADSALPPGRYAPVEDGTYLLPIADHWYIIRWESG
jgi:hypothetical protein